MRCSLTNKQLSAILIGSFVVAAAFIGYTHSVEPVPAPVETLVAAKIESKPAPVVGGEEVEREICVTTAGADYRLAVISMATGASTSQWLSMEAGNAATVPQPIVQGSPGQPQCVTIKVRAGETLKFNGWAKNTGLWHDYLAGNCPNPMHDQLVYTDGEGKCSAVLMTVDSTVNGMSDSNAQPATFNPSRHNYDLYWTNVP